MKKIISFVKEQDLWYVDLPEFLEQGLGVKGNLLMVAGADTYLEKNSKGKLTVTVEISDEPFENCIILFNFGIGADKKMLEKYNHPMVEHGGYYVESETKHIMWLCPTLLYVFETESYPPVIYFKFL